MVDGGLLKRHPRKRFHWGRHRRLLLHIRDRSLCFSHLLLQFMYFLLVLCVDLAILRMGFFQLVNAVALFFDLLAQYGDRLLQVLELLVVNGRRCRNRLGHQ